MSAMNLAAIRADLDRLKDVTSTSFGLIIAYLLPGLTGLYSLSFWFPRVQDLTNEEEIDDED